MNLIQSDKVFDALVAAGIVAVEDHVTRVVIDLQYGNVPVIHIQRLGDERLLSVVPTLEGVEIRRDGLPSGNGYPPACALCGYACRGGFWVAVPGEPDHFVHSVACGPSVFGDEPIAPTHQRLADGSIARLA